MKALLATLSLMVGSAGAQVLPWVECNLPTHVEATVTGLEIWSEAVPAAIVSITPGNAEWYTTIQAAVPELRIIPGLKTWSLLPDFDSASGWQRIAEEVRACLAVTHESTIVFEHERAVRGIWGDGGFEAQTIDAAALTLAIHRADLPRDVHYLWYPSIPGRDQEAQQRAMRICVAAQRALPTVAFIDNSSLSGPQALKTDRNILAGDMVRVVGDQPVVPMLYCLGPDKLFWQDAQIPGAVGFAGTTTASTWAIVYPGRSRWVEAACAITDAMGK